MSDFKFSTLVVVATTACFGTCVGVLGCSQNHTDSHEAALNALAIEQHIGWKHYEVLITENDGEKSVIIYNRNGVPDGEIEFVIRDGALVAIE